MTKYDKIYRIISIVNFVVHICAVALVTYAGFLPYRGARTTYESFVGFFGETLSTVHPYVILGILVLSCVGAFLAIERPHLSLLTFVFSFAFSLIAIFPFMIEAMVVGLASPWISASMATYGMGFDIINLVTRMSSLDLAFFVYAIVTLFVWAKRES